MVEWAKRFSSGIIGTITLILMLLDKKTVHLIYGSPLLIDYFFLFIILHFILFIFYLYLVATVFGKKELNELSYSIYNYYG